MRIIKKIKIIIVKMKRGLKELVIFFIVKRSKK
jgi:hypothetical protein